MEHSKSNPRKPGCYNRCIRSYLWSYYTHRQALAVAGYHAGTHWCSEKCRVSMVPAPNIKPTGGLRQLPDIPPVPLGAPENCANRQGLAGAGSHGSSTYAGLTWSSGIRHKLVPVGIMSVLYTTIEQAASTTHSEMATIAVQTSERAKRGMQKKGKSTP